jgi:uncharacterized protein (TIGR02996 family)
MSSQQSGLLSAICDNPEDDTPRLLLADWLEEHGGAAGAARAEFIRAQIELASLDPEDARFATLGERSSELEEANRDHWRGELPPWVRLPYDFVARETLSLPDHLPKSKIGDGGAQALARSPYLIEIQSLQLWKNRIGREVKQELQQRFGDRVKV